ncbi:kinase-like protein [Backusella circina FSU 941]|nr:kinase-like protein [Backusella circina FSU 941]
MNVQYSTRQSCIPQQQGIGQTLPPVPVGIDTVNSAPLGAMPPGTRVQVGKYQVIIHNFLAEGGFAHVYVARIEGKSGYVVLKRVVVPDQERLKMVEKEIEFMRRLGEHKNICRYYESRIDVLPTGGFQALILIEYCPGGGVIDLMNRRLQQRLTEPEILGIFSDVAEALAYLHYCNPPVLHRDIKVENILILNQNHYKLCDFGSAALSKGHYVPSTVAEIQVLEDDIQRHTTLQYRAPEMIDVYQKRPVNEKADIWAMGVLLYKLCFYTTPFEEHGQLAILNARYNIPSSPPFSEGLTRLIMSMLQEDQNRRPNVYQVMRAVCQLRGTECPIRDIYSESIQVSPSFSSPTPTNDIFEKVTNIPQQRFPDIKPMRRGRPTASDKSSTASEPATLPARSPVPAISPRNTSASIQKDASYDPFDTNHFSKLNKSAKTTPSSPASFQDDFTISDSAPSSIPITVHATPSPQLATRVQTQVNKEEKTVINKKVSSDIEARFNAIKASKSSPNSKPAPPPKPARFRSNQIPFKEKFPSVEELKKSLPS